MKLKYYCILRLFSKYFQIVDLQSHALNMGHLGNHKGLYKHIKPFHVWVKYLSFSSETVFGEWIPKTTIIQTTLILNFTRIVYVLWESN